MVSLLRGSVCLITGATHGIGAVAAEALGARGTRILDGLRAT